MSYATERALVQLAEWLRRNGPRGWDPFDVMGHPFLRACARNSMKGGWQARWWYLPVAKAKLYPMAARRLLLTRRQINAKGVGLLLGGWVRTERLGWPDAAQQAAALVHWLAHNASPGYPGTSWGYPFHWQSRIFIPRGTPSAVVTAICAQSLLDYAEVVHDEQAKSLAHGAATFIARGLNRFEAADSSVCLSYTPLDDFQVHNANLMAAEYLLRAGQAFGDPDWTDLAYRCLRFTLNEQQADGSFEYWSNAQMNGTQIDHYHTGFVLRSLHAFARTGSSEAADALDRGYAYYRNNLFGPGGRPLNRPDKDLPLDIHSCAESILCPAVLADRYGDDAVRLSSTAAEWTCANMQNPDGSFAHLMSSNGIDRTPYLRWGQAWMFRALTELAVASREKR